MEKLGAQYIFQEETAVRRAVSLPGRRWACLPLKDATLTALGAMGSSSDGEQTSEDKTGLRSALAQGVLQLQKSQL